MWFQEHFIKQNLCVLENLVSIIYMSGMPVLHLFSWKSVVSCLWQFSLILAGFGLLSCWECTALSLKCVYIWACYKLSAKTNFAWLGRSLHLAQILFGSNVFQGFALRIWLSVADRGSPSQMWTQTKGKAHALCWCVLPARMCMDEHTV